MDYKIVKLNSTDIGKETESRLSFWGNPLLLESFAKRDELNFYYLVVSNNEKMVAIMPVFERRKFGIKYIVQPYEYYYTPIDFLLLENQSFYKTQNHQLEIYKILASYLKKEFYKINIHFDMSIQDIRAFKWSKFDIEPLYTYVKSIQDYDSDTLPRETKRNLNNKAKKELQIKNIWDLEIYKSLSENMLNRINRSHRQIQPNFIRFLDDLHKKGFCEMYVALKDELSIACNILLKDKEKFLMYAFPYAVNEIGKEYRANSFCFDHIFSCHKEYNQFDFSGANIENIAYFKSQFNCELVSYYRVSKKIFNIK